MKSNPLQHWQENLKRGDLLLVANQNSTQAGVFVRWKGDNEMLLDYIALPWSWFDDTALKDIQLANILAGKDVVLSFLNTMYATRVVPLDSKMLPPKTKQIYEHYKTILNEY